MKRVVITGAAGGMGSAIVERFLDEGCEVIGIDVDDRRLADLHGRVGAPDRFRPLRLDLLDGADIVRGITELGTEYGQISAVVNGAGVITYTPFNELTLDEWDRVMAVNLRAPFLLSQAAVPFMPRGGVIVNITSITAERATGELAHYAASKGGLRLLTQAMAVALGPSGIRVLAVGPGSTMTPLTRERMADQERFERIRSEIPLGRLAEPEDIADVVVFAASDQARHMTGTTLYVDGGFLGRR